MLRIEDTDTERNRDEWVEGIERAMALAGTWTGTRDRTSSRSAPTSTRRPSKSCWPHGLAYACDCTDGGGPGAGQGAGRPARLRRVLPRPGPGAGDSGGWSGSAPRTRAPRRWSTSSGASRRSRTSSIEDFAIRKSNGAPLFILANVVDDADMAISHVIRGEDHLPNTPKYQLLWDALGYGPLPGLRPSAPAGQRQAPEAVQAAGQGGARGLPGRGLPARGHAQLPGPARLVAGRRPRGADARRADRRVPARGRQERAGVLRRAQAAGGQLRIPAPAADRGVRGPGLRPGSATPGRPSPAAVQERARTLGEVPRMVDFLYLADPVIDEKAWEKGVRRQPAFGRHSRRCARRLRHLRVDGDDAPRGHPGGGRGGGRTAAGQGPGPDPAGRDRDATSGRRCSSRCSCSAGSGPSPGSGRPGAGWATPPSGAARIRDAALADPHPAGRGRGAA